MWFNRMIKPQRLQSHSIKLDFSFGFFLNLEIILVDFMSIIIFFFKIKRQVYFFIL